MGLGDRGRFDLFDHLRIAPVFPDPAQYQFDERRTVDHRDVDCRLRKREENDAQLFGKNSIFLFCGV